MIEVFKTNVSNPNVARQLLVQLHETFTHCKANFDLEDCDLILRIQFDENVASVNQFIALLDRNGYMATLLAD